MLIEYKLLIKLLVTQIAGQNISVMLCCHQANARQQWKMNSLKSSLVKGQSAAGALLKSVARGGNWKSLHPFPSTPLHRFFFFFCKKVRSEMADNNRLQCFACSLSLPGGKPIDLQFILTNAKSMQRDMKSPRFLRLHSKIPETLCNSR